MTRVAIYPGSFDPVTNGHLDIITRGSKLVDHLIVSVAVNAGKSSMFSVDERIELLRQEISKISFPNTQISVVSFSGLLVDFAKEKNATMILRGLRAVTDFDYEFQMTGMNTRMVPDIETVFLMASEKNLFIASSIVKEVASLGGDISSFVPASVVEALNKH